MLCLSMNSRPIWIVESINYGLGKYHIRSNSCIEWLRTRIDSLHIHTLKMPNMMAFYNSGVEEVKTDRCLGLVNK